MVLLSVNQYRHSEFQRYLVKMARYFLLDQHVDFSFLMLFLNHSKYQIVAVYWKFTGTSSVVEFVVKRGARIAFALSRSSRTISCSLYLNAAAMSKRKAPAETAGENMNAAIVEALLELANYEKNVSRDIHKFNAYRKASSAIAKYPTKITSGDEAMQLPGVGKKIGAKIDEILATGKLKKLDVIRQDDTHAALKELTRVMGIGPAKAKELFDKGYKSLDDLRDRPEVLNHQQRIGLKYVEELEDRIPRAEVEELEKRVKELANEVDPGISALVCGSYRRGAESSGDIDLLVTKDGLTSEKPDKKHVLKHLVEHLEKSGFVTDNISMGEMKFMGVCRLSEDAKPRRIDIRVIPCDQFPCALLYFTGSDLFNQRMRSKAIEMGYTLNEYSLRPFDRAATPGEPVIITCEEDIFDYIDMAYVPPEKRNA